uniref:Uncharacterized protein n=1 Tax=Peronospora matthiolae TaxID=2874970 RepID=A0AAV1T867_9STRA
MWGGNLGEVGRNTRSNQLPWERGAPSGLCRPVMSGARLWGDTASTGGSWRGSTGSVWATVAVALTAPAVGLRSPAADAVAAEVSRRLAHARAWFAAASLDTKGVPHAQPAEKRSRKEMRRCRESLCRLSEAKLEAVYVHSVHVKRCALWAYTARTEAGSALAVDGQSAECLGPASTSSSSSCSACSRGSSSASSLKRRRLPPRRSTRGGDVRSDGWLPATSRTGQPPWGRQRSWQEPVQDPQAAWYQPCRVCSHRFGGRAQQDNSLPQGIGASHPARSGSMGVCQPSRSSQGAAAATAVYPARAGSSVATCPSRSSSLEEEAASSSIEEAVSSSGAPPSLFSLSLWVAGALKAPSARAVAATSADPSCTRSCSMCAALPGLAATIAGPRAAAGASGASGRAGGTVAHASGPGGCLWAPGEPMLCRCPCWTRSGSMLAALPGPTSSLAVSWAAPTSGRALRNV